MAIRLESCPFYSSIHVQSGPCHGQRLLLPEPATAAGLRLHPQAESTRKLRRQTPACKSRASDLQILRRAKCVVGGLCALGVRGSGESMSTTDCSRSQGRKSDKSDSQLVSSETIYRVRFLYEILKLNLCAVPVSGAIDIYIDIDVFHLLVYRNKIACNISFT